MSDLSASAASAPGRQAAEDPPRGRQNWQFWAVLIGLIAALVWSWGPAEMGRWPFLFTEAGNMAAYASGFMDPNFKRIGLYVEQMIVTVQIALWGTVLAVILGIPFAILSSNNMVPWWIVQPVRRLMDLMRAVHEVVFAVLFVVAVGLGPFAGVMALFVHNTGVVAKLFSEAVESIDPRPVEGIRATGATKLQEVVFGVIPQVLPLWISYTLYRFETNVRSATILGLIGAGGIGQIMFETIRGFYYAQAAAILLVVIVTVSLTDLLSQRIRKLVV